MTAHSTNDSMATNAGHETEKGPAAGRETPQQRDEPSLAPWRFWLLSVGLCLGLFLAMLDSSIVATSLYSIGLEFGSLDKINWVALAYTLAYLSCAVLFARVSDVVGRRNSFLASFVIFFAFSIGCGFAQTMPQLLACRALQGLGGSGLYSISMIIFPEVSPDHLKSYISSLVGMVIASAGVLGPVLGGVLTHYASWRWVFWINGPIGFVSMTVFYLSWPSDDQLPTMHRRSWRELDYVGSFLLLSAAVLVVFPFQNVGLNGDSWKQAIFLAPLLTGLFCWAALFAWQAIAERLWADRLAAAFPLRLIRNRVYAAGVLNTLLLGFGYLLTIYAFPLRLQVVNGKSSLMAGVMLLPMLGSVAVGSAVAGVISNKRNFLFETLTLSSCLMLLGFGLMTTLSASPELEAKALGFLVFIGLGFGMSATVSTILAITESSIRDHAPAQGIIAQVRILGGSIGIAASTAILGAKERDTLLGILSPGQLGLVQEGKANLTDTEAEAVRHAYADAFGQDMTVAAAISAAAILLTLLAYRRNRPSLAERRKQQVEEEMSRRAAARSGNLNDNRDDEASA